MQQNDGRDKNDKKVLWLFGNWSKTTFSLQKIYNLLHLEMNNFLEKIKGKIAASQIMIRFIFINSYSFKHIWRKSLKTRFIEKRCNIQKVIWFMALDERIALQYAFIFGSYRVFWNISSYYNIQC